MRASAHTAIVRGACGCAVIGTVLTVVVLIVAIDRAKGPEAAAELRRTATAALDTLRADGLPPTTVVFESDSFVLPAPAATAVLRVTGRLWSDTTRTPSAIPYGDTLPARDPARARWLRAGGRPEVDSLLALRGVVWRSGGKVSQGAPGRAAALYHARAVLARARRAADSGAVEVAEWLLRVIVTVGHDQQSGPSLLRAITGVRLERDALDMLSRVLPRPHRLEWGRGATRADSLLVRLLETRRRMRLVARDVAQLDTLAAWARDPAVPIPLRDECVRAIGTGWVDDEVEVLSGVAARRDEVLGRLEDSLPAALTAALRGARVWATAAGLQRLVFAAEYSEIVDPLLGP